MTDEFKMTYLIVFILSLSTCLSVVSVTQQYFYFIFRVMRDDQNAHKGCREGLSNA